MCDNCSYIGTASIPLPSAKILVKQLYVLQLQLAQLATYTSTRQETTTITIAATGITNDTQLLTILVQTLRPYTKTTIANLTPPLLITATNYATITITITAAPLQQSHNHMNTTQQLPELLHRHTQQQAA